MSTLYEHAMFRIVKAYSLPAWQAEEYFYSYQYERDSDTIRQYMKENNITQDFMLYGDAKVSGKLLLKGSQGLSDYFSRKAGTP